MISGPSPTSVRCYGRLVQEMEETEVYPDTLQAALDGEAGGDIFVGLVLPGQNVIEGRLWVV